MYSNLTCTCMHDVSVCDPTNVWITRNANDPWSQRQMPIAESAVEWPWLAGQNSHTWYSGSLWPNSEFYPWPPANWAMGHCHVTCLWTHDMRHWRKRKYLLVNRYYWKQFMPNEYKTMNFITGKQNWYLSEKKKKVLHIYEPRSKGANALSIPIQTSMTNLLGLI